MILIADSGSTKTDWAVLGAPGGSSVRIATQGINPLLFTDDQIDGVFRQELLPRLDEAGVPASEKIKSAAALFDISVLDHIIVGEDGYFSYVDEGRL